MEKKTNSHISKADGTDIRAIEISHYADNVTVEVFQTTEMTQARFNYIASVYEAAPVFEMRMYISADGLALLRIPVQLTAKEGKQDEAVMNEFCTTEKILRLSESEIENNPVKTSQEKLEYELHTSASGEIVIFVKLHEWT